MVTLQDEMAGAEPPAISTLTTRVAPEVMLDQVRSSLSRDLPSVKLCKPHGATLCVAGGGPSLSDTYRELSGYIGAVNGSLAFLLDKGVVPDACAVLDPGPQMADIVPAEPRVRYFIASVCHPALFDKLISAGCAVHIWHPSGQPGLREFLDETGSEWLMIGGGTTVGVRWLDLGYVCGFRSFDLHGLDSSFRGAATHAYPDAASYDTMMVDGYRTKPAFLAQVHDFFAVMHRFSCGDNPINVRMFGDGLLQGRWRTKNS